MKRIVSTLAIILVCVVALSGCSWFSTPVTLADDYDLTEKSTVKSEVFSEIKEKNAICTFSGSDNGYKYVWVVFGKDIVKPVDVDLGLNISTFSDGKLSVRFFNEKALDFKPLLSIYLTEKIPGQSYVAVFFDGQTTSVSLTGSEKSVLNFTVLNAVGEVGIFPGDNGGNEESGDRELSDGSTVRDQYMTDYVPEGKPLPVEPGEGNIDMSVAYTCTFLIECKSIFNNLDKLDSSKLGVLPSDGIVYERRTVTFYKGESVFDLLKRVCRDNDIHLEYSNTPVYNSAYIEGINNLYEFDCGNLSGWVYGVNGWFPNYGCSRYQLAQGDVVEWRYTCDLGRDVGCNWKG